MLVRWLHCATGTLAGWRHVAIPFVAKAYLETIRMRQAIFRPGQAPERPTAPCAIGPAGNSVRGVHALRMIDKRTQTACINCSWQKLCMPMALSPYALKHIDEAFAVRRKLKRGETLFQNGDLFTGLYAVRSGFFKTSMVIELGREQVTGFQMPGEVLGLEGILHDRHTCSEVALQDAEVCALPLDRIAALSLRVKGLQHHVHAIMSREIVRAQDVMLMLGSMRSEERLAAFLLNLVGRLHARGFSRTELILQMTREDIGSYLGMKIETVSRIFTRLMEQGLIEVNQRHIHILDAAALTQRVSLFGGESATR